MSLSIEPLPKKIYNRALDLGAAYIKLSFSGGNDEGNCDITLSDENNVDLSHQSVGALIDEIENWVWEVYQYSGAGDGSDYGDEIAYNLKTMIATTQEWWMERSDQEEESEEFVFAEEEEDEEEDTSAKQFNADQARVELAELTAAIESSKIAPARLKAIAARMLELATIIEA